MFSPWKKAKGGWSRSWHPSEKGRPGHDPLPGCERLVSRAERYEGTVDCDDRTMARLDEVIAMASAYVTEKWIPTTSLINPMLEVWEAANAIHPAVARPVEEFLTALIHRTTVAPDEIGAVVDETRLLALQASVIAGGMKVS
jgi:hypothetical protein